MSVTLFGQCAWSVSASLLDNCRCVGFEIADIWANHVTVPTVVLKMLLHYTKDFGFSTAWVLVHMTFDTFF